MSRHRLTLATIVLVGLAAGHGAAAAGALVIDLRQDPLDPGSRAPALEIQGGGPDRFVFDAARPRIGPSDSAGSLRVLYDSTLPTARAVAPLGEIYSEQDDFVFGAIVTIRPENFEADPTGFHPVTFSLVNTATTGFDRTGDPDDFRSDAFDTIDVAWFPQVSPIFGGPYLGPALFGSRVSDDAFANFAFGSVPFAIPAGTPHLIVAEHDAAGRRLAVTVFALGPGGRPVPIPGGRAEVDLAYVSGFAVDALAITSYEDGFNIYAGSGRSLLAALDYDLLFFAPGSLGPRGGLPALMGMIRRGAEGAHGLSR